MGAFTGCPSCLFYTLMNPKKFNPKDYTREELQRLATIGLKAEIERALARLPEGYIG